MTTPYYELLKDAYAIIDGIPAKQFDLKWFSSGKGVTPNDCGTIACAGGWLTLHPAMRALGLRNSTDESTSDSTLAYGHYRLAPRFNDEDGFEALAEFFSIPCDAVRDLFGVRNGIEFESSCNDKELWLYRVRKYLRDEGQLT